MVAAWTVTFSVDAQAPMVEPELTEVGELHSLTDWQVSEASEEAELDEFCSGEGPHKGADKPNHRPPKIIRNKKEWGRGGQIQKERQTNTQKREG